MPIKKKIARALTKRSQQKRFAKIKEKVKPSVTSKRLKRRLVTSKVKKGAKAFGKGATIGAGAGGVFLVGVGSGASGQREVSRRKNISKGLKRHHKKRKR